VTVLAGGLKGRGSSLGKVLKEEKREVFMRKEASQGAITGGFGRLGGFSPFRALKVLSRL